MDPSDALLTVDSVDFFFFLGFPIGKNSINYNSKISLCIGLLESGSFIWFPVVKGEQRKHNHLEFSPA